MSATSLELDFFGMEKENPSKSQLQRLLEQRKTIRGLQTSLSNMNPQVLKTVIQSGTADAKSLENGSFIKQDMFFRQKSFNLGGSVPSTPKGNQGFVSAHPLFNPAPALRNASESLPEMPNPPLTIFYNGKVTVFDVPRDKAEIIIKLAEEGKLKVPETVDAKATFPLPSTSSDQQQALLLEKLNGDFPIARKKSLQRFLEKRKERMTMVSPYGADYAVDKNLE